MIKIRIIFITQEMLRKYKHASFSVVAFQHFSHNKYAPTIDESPRIMSRPENAAK